MKKTQKTSVDEHLLPTTTTFRRRENLKTHSVHLTKKNTLVYLEMGKTYVVFIGRKPGLYETWEEAHKQVNKFSGASYRSFYSRDEALKDFDSYMGMQVVASSSTSNVEQTSYATSTSSSSASVGAGGSSSATQAQKITKLKDALSSLIAMTEEIKQQIDSLKIDSDD